ncbi:MAG: hypothetical protein Aurels2KO_58200 [Aureliella sp.]
MVLELKSFKANASFFPADLDWRQLSKTFLTSPHPSNSADDAAGPNPSNRFLAGVLPMGYHKKRSP